MTLHELTLAFFPDTASFQETLRLPGKGDSQEEPGDAGIAPRGDLFLDSFEESQQLEEEFQELQEFCQELKEEEAAQFVPNPGEHDDVVANSDPCDDDQVANSGPSGNEIPDGNQPRKRVLLRDLTPNSKEVEIERRKQAKRDNSNQWHAKWASKGVPKEEGVPAQAGEPAQPVDPPVVPEAPGPAAPVEELDGFKPDPEILHKAVQNDMRSVRAQWMNQWTAWKKNQDDHDGDVEKLRKEAAEKWLNSELRAQLHATRSHKQFWIQQKVLDLMPWNFSGGWWKRSVTVHSSI